MKMKPGIGQSPQLGNVQMNTGYVKHQKLINYVYKLEQENKFLRQGLMPGGDPKALMHNMKENNLSSQMKPGNVEDITRAIWPFYFSTTYAEVVPGQSVRTSFTVTQEAAFIWLYTTKTVHVDDAGITRYIDPNNFDVDFGQANGLAFTIRDAQSTREFNQLPIPTDMVGDPMSPWALPSPVFFLPNATVEVQFINSNLTNTYYPSMSFFGYRVRLDQREKMLSMVTG